jgi:hypothetical protein
VKKSALKDVALRGAAATAAMPGGAFTKEGYIVADPWGQQEAGDSTLVVDATGVTAGSSKCPIMQIKSVNAVLTSTDPEDMEVLSIFCANNAKPFVFELDDAREAKSEIKKLAGMLEVAGEENNYDADTSGMDAKAASGREVAAIPSDAKAANGGEVAAIPPAGGGSAAAALTGGDAVAVAVVGLGEKFDPSGKTADGQELTLSISKEGIDIMAGTTKLVQVASSKIQEAKAVLSSADETDMESLVIVTAIGTFGFEVEDAREARDLIRFYLGKYKQDQAGEYDSSVKPTETAAKATYEMSVFPRADLDPSHKMPTEALMLVSKEGIGIQDAKEAASSLSDTPAYMMLASQIKSVKAIQTSQDPEDMEDLLVTTSIGIFAFETEDAREVRDAIKMTFDLGVYEYAVGYGYDKISEELQAE